MPLPSRWWRNFLARPRGLLPILPLGGLLALALLPAIFGRLFAMGPLEPDAAQILVGAAGGVALTTTGAFLLGSRRGVALLLGVFGVLLLELGVRAWVVATWSDARRGELERMRRILAGETVEYLAHPFLQYVGNPRFDANLAPDQGRPPARPYNRFGFPDDQEFRYARTPGSLRIACLGGSTTAGAYPGELEAWLQERLPGTTVEVLNFGMGGWTSAHSLANYVLNVVDFQPDYVVLHDGHNDFVHALDARPEQLAALRGDYAHLAGLYAGPTDSMAPSLEAMLAPSLLYRLARHEVVMPKRMQATPYEELPLAGGGATLEMVQDGPWPFRRNVESLLAVAGAHDQRVVLLTQPHRVGGGPMGTPARDRFIHRCNQALAELAAAYPGDVLLVDLVAALPQAPQVHFVDNIHLDIAGEQWKAAQVGAAILADWHPAASMPGQAAP